MLVKIKDLSKEQLIIGVCLICLGLSILGGIYYKNKATKLEIILETTTTTLQIERKKAKLAGNLQDRLELQDALNALTKDHTELSGKYEALLGSDVSYTQIMNQLGDMNNNEDICAAWLKLGYPICE